MIHILLRTALIFLLFLGCKENSSKNNTPQPNTAALKDSSNLLIEDTGTFMPDTTLAIKKQILPNNSEENNRIEELIVGNVEQKSDDEFKKYYLFEIQNTSAYTLKSFKFGFKYTRYKYDESDKPEYEYAIVKQNLTANESTIIKIYPPQSLAMKEESRSIVTYEPILYGAVTLEDKIIFTIEGRRIEKEKLDKYINDRIQTLYDENK